MEAPPNKTHLPIYTYNFTFARYSILRLYPPRSLWQARLKTADPALTRLARLIARMLDDPHF